MNPLARYFLLGLLGWPGMGGAQQFSVDWHRVGGGGGTSSGDLYTLNGTAGQPEAGERSGENIYLTSGFWSDPATAFPTLEITPAGPGQVVVSWKPNIPGFKLEVSSGLAPANWRTLSGGGSNPTTMYTGTSTMLFRLRRAP